MAKFTVDVKEVWCHTVEVDLPTNATKEQIVAAANDKSEEGDDGNTEYSHTLDPETWTIRDSHGKNL
jgi:hypothetical protein